MADIHSSQPANAPAVKTRSPVERVLVWGLIGALLVAVAIEFQSRTSYQKALTTLQDGVEAVDKNQSHPEVTQADVKAAVGDKKPAKTEDLSGEKTAANGAKFLEVYSWFTFNPTSKREIWVWYGAKGIDPKELATVIEVQSSETIAQLPEIVSAEPSHEDMQLEGGPAGPPGGMRGGPGMGGPSGGMGGPPGMGGMQGSRRGRPGTGTAADNADKADAGTTDADKADADKPDADKADTDQPDTKPNDNDKIDDDKTGADNASEETTAEDKTEKTDPDKE